ncbi:MAG: TonB-dependent receptor [Cyclobacteriaceae bacterium]|nr:TonB-dependent receptor [Cyclobacteriaceae bacterium]UYN88476.1 MAG: TonB-dependent receptor [Cyclobacteriaceae bacterium]
MFLRSLLIYSLLILLLPLALMAQEDSLRIRQLNEVEVKAQRLLDMSRLPESSGTYLWSGKKNEVISLGGTNANIAEKTGRQIFAKVPGVFVYDMDGSGNQMNISTRGLDPHRGWEFNIRRNGSITNSDMYGYPASHYSIPMEAVDRIELVRGTGSLQYGAQFGGMLNYVTKAPDSTQAFSLESISTAGSYGLLSTYIAASGTVGKFQYATYYTKRVSDGYRENSETDYDAQSLQLIYSPVNSLKLTAELSRSNYLYRIPGPLTDEMFAQDSRQATRSRNYFNPEIYVPSFQVDWKLSDNTKVSWLTSAVLGDRNSVMFDRPANVPDVIDPITNQFAPRQVDIDNFNSYTSELRLLHTYTLNRRESKLVAGMQYFNNDLHRRQQGKGTTGTDFDLTVTDLVFGRDMHLKSTNVALFAENKFQVTDELSITPGIRYETGQSNLTGIISYYDADEVPNTIEHKFPLLGVSARYSLKHGSLYAGWAQAYRPVIFKDIIPASVYERVDKNLKDAYGYNLEAGFRGNTKHLRWDVGVFHLQYNNRLGAQALRDGQDEFYIYRTNIGNSATTGTELYLEYVAPLYKRVSLSAFTSTAVFNSRYTHAQIRSGESNVDISGNKLESVPDVITRNGITLRSALGSVSLLYSYVGKTFADAMNTVNPSATGAVGLVPGYGLFDLNSTFVFRSVTVRINVNNITNKQYFTKRPSFYPGPGIWPSDGRSLVVSVGFKV